MFLRNLIKISVAAMTRVVLIWSLTRLLWEGARRASSETGLNEPVFYFNFCQLMFYWKVV